MMRVSRLLLLIYGICFVMGIGAQQQSAAATPLQNGFGSLQLGLAFEDVEQRLQESGAFRYRGEPDVSLIPMENRRVIEAAGSTFVERGFFQFNGERLYIIILQLDQAEIDHYTMYTELTEKYGEPDSLSPQRIVWENDTVRLSLERPLTVKYVAKAVFESIVAEGEVEESIRTLSREEFLEQF